MSVVFILYICHLVPSYQVIKTLSCCMKDLWGQRSECGTPTSCILKNPMWQQNPHLYSYEQLYYHSSHISSLNTFRTKHMWNFYCLKPTLRSLKTICRKNSARALAEHVLKTLFTTRWHTNLSYATVSNVLWIVWDHRLIYLIVSNISVIKRGVDGNRYRSVPLIVEQGI